MRGHFVNVWDLQTRILCHFLSFLLLNLSWFSFHKIWITKPNGPQWQYCFSWIASPGIMACNGHVRISVFGAIAATLSNSTSGPSGWSKTCYVILKCNIDAKLVYHWFNLGKCSFLSYIRDIFISINRCSLTWTWLSKRKTTVNEKQKYSHTALLTFISNINLQ